MRTRLVIISIWLSGGKKHTRTVEGVFMELSRKQIKRGIILSVSVSIVALLLVMLLTRENLTLKTFTRVRVSYLIAAAVITLVFWTLKTLKLKVLARSLGGRISFSKLFSIYVASAFVAHVTPSSSGGLPFMVYFVHRERLPLGKSTALSVFENMSNVIFYMVIAPVLLLVWGNHLHLGSVITRLFYIAVVLVIIFIIVSFVLVFNTHLALVFVNWLTGLGLVNKIFSRESLEKFKNFIETEINYFNQGFQLLIKKKKQLVLLIFYTILYWLFYLSIAPVLLLGLGLKVAVPPVILAQLVFNFIQPVIPTPGGSGGAELSFAYLFKFMVPGPLLGVFVALWRFFIFYASLIVGGICFIQLVQGTDYLN